jgi:hypothetical protein
MICPSCWQNENVLDARLVGRWSDDVLYLGSMEDAAIVFCSNGSGWSYWARAGGVFSLHRFGWRTAGGSRLHLRLRQVLSGTWTLQGREIRHCVTSRYSDDTELPLVYTIKVGQDVFGNTATLLELDRPVIPGTVGDRFALVHSDDHVEDPVIGGASPGS